ncbi:hypothetical protein IV38_GL001681 [Lactobacillus selangorensis]|uniref:DUF3114 domain-containing protein n=1 Tax=Lactobacillus selangorensis TaxID=81857 RepID=A0A0R2FHZ7_9LACO|nr:DUF3114 domain-containing protein [Lactobacillus selangorensis]KRN28227.1 hypothetical protein IV38_GL001681 [Lactobacillus selangorensis]KRN30897.1 hypothetical protein IV40_GL001534 [Lactobacillus selangorensis]
MGNTRRAQHKLRFLLAQLEFPNELANNRSQVNQLVVRLGTDLAPQAFFWRSLSRTVQLAFPHPQYLEGSLGKQVHQLRYVISLQQAEFVQTHYAGATDQEKLAHYLRTLPHFLYSFSESDRYHQKRSNHGQGALPSGTGNLKVTVGFHAEFILDSTGRFTNILDGTLNGVVNGASFNYACRNDATHRRLDVQYRASDPVWRTQMIRTQGFKAPTLAQYRDSKGPYAVNGYSARQNSQFLKKKLAQSV